MPPLAAAALALLLAAGAVAGGATESPLAAKVRQLIVELDDEDIAVRNAAEQELIKLGPPVLDHLPPITATTPSEVRIRLERVRGKLERAAAAAVSEPSRVTLKGRMKLSQAIAGIEKQTGNRLLDLRDRFGQEPRDAEIELDLTSTAFWPAIDQVFGKAGVEAYHYTGQSGAFGYINRPQGRAAEPVSVAYAGPFRIEPVQVAAVRDLRTNGPTSVKLELEISWEPRLSPIALEQPLSQIRLAGESAQVVALGNTAGQLEWNGRRGVTAARFEIPLTATQGNRKIDVLRGRLTAILPARIETFEFANLSTAEQQQRKAAVVVTLREARTTNESHQILLRVRFDKSLGALQSHRQWIDQNPAWLESPAGKLLPLGRPERTREAKSEVGLRYDFKKVGSLGDYKFVYRAPAAILKLPIDYEVKGIPLP